MNSVHRLLYQTLTLLLIPLCLFGTRSAYGQEDDQEKVIVSYIYNFAKNIRWPNENQLASFDIGLYQAKPELLTEFYKLHNTATLKSVPIRISQVRNINNLSDYALIYAPNIDGPTLSRIQSSLNGKPTLVITNNITNKRIVMINLLKTSNQQIKFEVNKANLINNQLTPLPELILLGGTEIDVAKLYREGQNSLLSLQKQLSEQQQRLTNLQRQITTQENNNKKLVNQMQEFNQDITRLRETNTQLTNELEGLQATIENSKQIISQQQNDIALSEKQKQTLIAQVKERNRELDKQQQQLDIRQQELASIGETISLKEQQLVNLNLTISRQETQISAQQASINELDELVNTQKKSLYYLYGLAGGGILFILLGIYAYRIKRRDNERLEKHAKELEIASEKLQIAKRKAEAANKAKSAFLSLMSHELRTPLQSIIGYSDFMIEEMKHDDNDYLIDQLSRIHSNGERLLELINNTLDLAKIESGKMQVNLTPSQMSTVIDEATSSVRPLIQKNNNQFIVDIDNDQVLVDIDFEKLVHSLVNLVSNANKFTHDGAIKITINNQPKLLKIIVSDTGTGMTEDQLKVIFGHFQQAVKHRKAGLIKGTGLGLSITQHFCELMGGSVRAESEIGKGSEFIIEIPLPVVITEKQFLLDDPEDIGQTNAA